MPTRRNRARAGQPTHAYELTRTLTLVLNRVVWDEFFRKFKATEAVRYFYEPFLEQFDPLLRKELGVWYTPPEIVEYMVGRVDHVLRTELNRPDGLPDESVYVLDPCCVTGAFLIEVLRRIDATLKNNGADATRAAKLKRAAIERIFGFELLPARYVIAHFQLGLFLADAGAPLTDDGGKSGERAAVYLTNALTGCDAKTKEKQMLFEELERERAAATAVKRGKPILMVLGNPPYAVTPASPRTRKNRSPTAIAPANIPHPNLSRRGRG